MISMTHQPPPYPLLVGSFGQNEGVTDQIVAFILTAEDKQAGALIAEHFSTRDAQAALRTQLAARGLSTEQIAPAFSIASAIEKGGVPVGAMIGVVFILGGLAIGATILAGIFD